MRRFSGRLVVAALAVAGGYVAARSIGLTLSGPAGASRAPTPGGPAPVAVSPAELADAYSDGNALVGRVLDQLERWPNVAAKFRQTVRIENEPLTGAGEYWQQGVGTQRRTCWQWQTLAGGQKSVFCQVYDKNENLWTDCRFPEKRTITRVNVASVRRELTLAADAAGQGRAASRADLEVLARGGLSQLVAELRRCFAFDRPLLLAAEGQPRLAIVGRWRPDVLEREWPGLAPDAAADWPPHLPHHVVLQVGHRDLFPYAVEYRRADDSGRVASVGAVGDPLARYEFFDVQWAVSMPERLFEFSSSDLDWHDVTPRTIERLRPAPAIAQTASPTAR